MDNLQQAGRQQGQRQHNSTEVNRYILSRNPPKNESKANALTGRSSTYLKFSLGACMLLSGRPKANTVVVALRCC